MRRPVLSLLAVYALSAGAFIGALTNWFRYPLPIEATVVAALLGAGGVFLAVLAAIAIRRDAATVAAAMVPAALGALFLALLLHRQSFGRWLPAAHAAHVESSGTATLVAHGRPVFYRLELANPFSRSHRETLVIEAGGAEHRVDLPLFDRPLAAFGSANTPADWITLRPTGDPQVFVAQIGSHLTSGAQFDIDLRTDRATRSRR